MGGSFEFHDLYAKRKPVLIYNFMKLILFVAIFLPIAVPLGSVNDRLMAALVMLGSATTISYYITARNIGHKGTPFSSVVVIMTLGNVFVLMMWLYILKGLGIL